MRPYFNKNFGTALGPRILIVNLETAFLGSCLASPFATLTVDLRIVSTITGISTIYRSAYLHILTMNETLLKIFVREKRYF